MGQKSIITDHRVSKEAVTSIVRKKMRFEEKVKETLIVYLVRNYVSKMSVVFIKDFVMYLSIPKY